MITISSDIISDYAGFVAGTFEALLPLIGMTAGVFVAFAIFERVVTTIRKASK